MSSQPKPTTISNETVYIHTHSADGHVEKITNNKYESYHDVTISPSGGLAANWDFPEYEPHPILEQLAGYLISVEVSIRATSDRIMQHPTIVDINSSETAQQSFKQRLKFLMAMLFLIGIAVIFFLFQLSSSALQPPDFASSLYSPAAQPALLENNIALATDGRSISAIFSPEVRQWEAQIVQWAAEFGVDPNAVATIMQIESCGDPLAESGAGAQGLFQVMPFHFSAEENMKDPATNARRGIAYYKLGMDLNGGNTGLTFAGYNGGHSVANKSQDQWAHETRRYFYWATGIYADAQAGLQSSERLQEWMQAGGASLCSQAASRVFPTSN